MKLQKSIKQEVAQSKEETEEPEMVMFRSKRLQEKQQKQLEKIAKEQFSKDSSLEKVHLDDFYISLTPEYHFTKELDLFMYYT